MAHRIPVPLVLGAALIGVSAAGTLVRLAPDAHPLTLGFGRVLLAGLILLPFARQRPSPRDLALTALAGTLLALHFWAWFTSLAFTTVVRSTVIVCTTPIWVGLAEALVLKKPPPARYWPGIGVALLGVVALSAGVSGGGLQGDALALLGSWLGAGYFVIGSVVRERVDIGTYGPLVCLAAAAVLGVLAVVLGVPLMPTGAAVGVVVAMTLGPQLLGHIGFNWAVRYVPARTIAAVVLLEPVGAAILAALLLAEWPPLRDLLAGAVLIAGVGIAVSPAPKPSAKPPSNP